LEISQKTRNLILIATSLVTILSACRPAESALEIIEPWVRAAAVGLMPDTGSSESAADATPSPDHQMASGGAVSAAYMTILNSGGASDRLTGGTTPAAATVEIHTVEMEGDVMRMRPLPDGLEIPAGGSVTLQPGGYHLMLLDLRHTLAPGATLELTLSFASGRQITVQAEIRAP
jgi:copper(I)-binding protein